MVNNEHIAANLVDGTSGIIIVDPNGVIKDYQKEYRYILPEDLMIYVSVQAQMNPKTLIYNESDGVKVINIASGKFYSSTGINDKQTLDDAISNKDNTHYTTAWTEMYDANRPEDVEGFGIGSIEMEFNASLVPKIHIEFIDVRGKNLLERGGDQTNPYNAFYTFPYPLFQLTVKGYFGKAITIPLVMEKAITRFDPSTGNYLISADFKSWTFAMLNDVVLLYAVIVEKMFKEGDTYLGRKFVEMKYAKYYESEMGAEDIKQMEAIGYVDASSRPLDRVDSLIKMFALSNSMGTLISDGLLAITKERNAAVSAFLNELSAFKTALDGLIENSSMNDQEKITEMKALVTRTNSYFDTQKSVINKLSTAAIPSAKYTINVFNVELSSDDYQDANNKLVAMDDAQYNKMSNDIIEFERERQEQDSKDFKTKIVKQFGFYPSIKNVVKAIVMRIDAFMDLLRFKSEEIAKKVLDPKVKLLDPNKNYEIVETSNGEFRRMPWPEFYVDEAGEQGKVKSFPGMGTAEQREWGEVKFIDEIYSAAKLAGEEMSKVWNNFSNNTNVFLLTPLTEPTLLGNTSAIKDDPVTTLNRLLQQILDSVYHNGLLYKTIESGNLYGKGSATSPEGIYDIMIKNVIDLMIEDWKTIPNGLDTLNLIKARVSLITNSEELSKYMNRKDINFDGVDELKGSSITNHLSFITKPHLYQSTPTFTKGDKWFDHFKEIYVVTNDNATVGIQQLSCHPSWVNSVDLMNFNNITVVNQSAISALTFTNNYDEEDIFITRSDYEISG